MANVKDRVAVVTGASRGIGKGITRELITAAEASAAATRKDLLATIAP
jgi:NADP-dependent 3-hydroxy acid dehydrogenase YdfG